MKMHNVTLILAILTLSFASDNDWKELKKANEAKSSKKSEPSTLAQLSSNDRCRLVCELVDFTSFPHVMIYHSTSTQYVTYCKTCLCISSKKIKIIW